MKLEATVKIATGNTKHYLAQQFPIEKTGLSEFPPAERVEIVEDDDGYFLFRYSATNEFAGDSWFESIEECMRQAEFEYGIAASDWIIMD